MRFTTYIIFMMCIGISAWFFGFRPVSMSNFMQTNAQPLDMPTFIGNLASAVSSDSNVQQSLAVSVATVAVAGLVSLFSGFGAIYLIPLSILILVLNFLVFPVSAVIAPNCAQSISSITSPCSMGQFNMILSLLFNTLTILAILNFVRGAT